MHLFCIPYCKAASNGKVYDSTTDINIPVPKGATTPKWVGALSSVCQPGWSCRFQTHRTSHPSGVTIWQTPTLEDTQESMVGKCWRLVNFLLVPG